MVSDAIGMDKRIGRRYLTGGFGYGGPCFPRDNVALNFIGQHLGASTQLLEVNDTFNRTISPRFVDKLKAYLHKGSTVAVLGLAYKPLSHVIEESAGMYLCLSLASSGFRVSGMIRSRRLKPKPRAHACIGGGFACSLPSGCRMRSGDYTRRSI